VTVNTGDPTPAYVQIANQLRSQIERGELRDGAQLPSQRELVAQSGTAPGTVQRAISQLESEGLVVKIQGRGTFVRHPRRLRRDGSTRHQGEKRPPGAGPMESEAAAQNFSRKQIVRSAGREAVPLAAATRLGVSEGELLLTRRFILTLDDEPTATAASYFMRELADDPVLRAPVEVPGGTHEYLRKELGIPLDYGIEDLIARMPTPDDHLAIHLVPGTPVAELTRTIYAQGDRPVEATVFVYAADRYEFRYRVPMI